MYYKFYCAEKKDGIRISPVLDLEIIPYRIIGVISVLIGNNTFKIVKGTKLYDVLPFDKHFRNFAISEKFKSLLESLNITGWNCFPILIEGIDEQYYCFQNIGYIGPIINLKEKYNNLELTKIIKSKVLLKSWDESSIFIIEKTLTRLCEVEVANAIKKSKITNIKIEPAEDFEFIK